MSRVGKIPVTIPNDVTATIEGRSVTVSGPKGSLQMVHPPKVTVAQGEGSLSVVKKNNSRQAGEQYGLTRTLLANMVHGVAEGFERRLEINGVGYSA